MAKNPNTSTVILGASTPEQLLENLKALEVLPKLTDEIMKKIENILANGPEPLVSSHDYLFSFLFSLVVPIFSLSLFGLRIPTFGFRLGCAYKIGDEIGP